MAKRTTTKRFFTDDAQGEGSFVVMRSLRVGQRREYIQASKDDADFSSMEWILGWLQTHLLEWNWVNEEGELLPLPMDDPEVLNDLTDPESEVLAKLLIGSDTKN